MFASIELLTNAVGLAYIYGQVRDCALGLACADAAAAHRNANRADESVVVGHFR